VYTVQAYTSKLRLVCLCVDYHVHTSELEHSYCENQTGDEIKNQHCYTVTVNYLGSFYVDLMYSSSPLRANIKKMV
jgi:hypothetical protein